MDQKTGYDDPSSLEMPAPIVDSLDKTVTGGDQPPHNKHIVRYVFIAIGVIILLAGITLAIVKSNHKTTVKPSPVTTTPIVINTQSLDNGTLNKITSQAGPTETKQQLTITPDTLFKNTVEVQGNTKLDKNIDVGGNATVAGTTTLQGAVGINSNLAVRGSLNVGGTISAASINVGSLAITTINVSGSLNFGGHIVPGGATPQTKISTGASGGTVTISGNDTAGTITITIGSGQIVAGELAIITFQKAFATTPKVQLTPINPASSALNYYATRSASFFTVDTATAPTTGASYVFDYLVTQ